jgi:hypothetical protein
VNARLFAIGLALVCAASAASACKGKGTPRLDDTFKNADPGWGRADNVAAFTAHGLILRPPAQGSAWRWNQGYKMERADLCVEVGNPAILPMEPDEQSVGAVGLWFWGKDAQNFYTASITLDGKASIDRLVAGTWQDVVSPLPAPAIKTAPGAVNELEILSSGASAGFYINGVMVTEIKGEPPKGGGAPGVYGESGPNGTAWTFARVRLY